MPRIGLVRFARVALEAAQAVVPDYRAPRSKHTFTQPQLLAVLCLMRYDGWTFRDAETRLAEHGELRRALGLRRVPDHTTLWRFLDRLPLRVLQELLAEVLRRCGPPRGPRGGRRKATLAVDATGLATGSLSTFFVRRLYEIKGQVRERAYWLKWLVALDVDRLLILAQAALRGPRCDMTTLPALLAAAAARLGGRVAWVLADKEFDAEPNHRFVREELRARAAIAVRRLPPGSAGHRGPYRAALARAFPRAQYARRVLAETLFSAVKRTQGGTAPGRRERTQVKQAHLVGISYDLARLDVLTRTA